MKTKVFPKAKVPATFKPDIILEFESEKDLYDWIKRVYALPFAISETGQKFYIVQGRIVEAKIATSERPRR